MLSVNGVLVKGSEGYPVVVGKVKRELARLVEPVAGSDSAGGGAAAPTDASVRGGMKRQLAPSPLSQVRSGRVLKLFASCLGLVRGHMRIVFCFWGFVAYPVGAVYSVDGGWCLLFCFKPCRFLDSSAT